MVFHEHGNWSRRLSHVCWNRMNQQTTGSGGGGGGAANPQQPSSTPTIGLTNIFIYQNINYGGNREILTPLTTSQIYMPADYSPFFQNFNDEVSSAILAPSPVNFQNGITFILFKDAGFQNSYDAIYFSPAYPANNPAPVDERKIYFNGRAY